MTRLSDVEKNRLQREYQDWRAKHPTGRDGWGSELPWVRPEGWGRVDDLDPTVTRVAFVPDENVREDENGYLVKPPRGAVRIIEEGAPPEPEPKRAPTNALGQVRREVVGKVPETAEEAFARMEGRDGRSITERAMASAKSALLRLNEIEEKK